MVEGEFKCLECGYSTIYKDGPLMNTCGVTKYWSRFGNSHLFQDVLDGHFGVIAQNILKENEETASITTSKEMYYCPTCKKYAPKNMLSIYVKGEGEIYKSEEKCDYCHSDLKTLDENNFDCPKCGTKHSMEVRISIYCD